MKKLFVGAFLLFTAVGYAKNHHPLDCEVEAFSAKADRLNLVCPPLFDFSPIRVDISLGKINPAGWSHLDLQGPTPAKVMQPSAGEFLVRLPHREGSHRWLAWRRFDNVKIISIRKDSLN